MGAKEDRLGWMLERPLQPPTILNHWDGVPSILLFKTRSGAILWWMFDEDDDDQLGMFAHLTDDEAQAVFEGNLSEGLLEPIRRNMSQCEAIVWAVHNGSVHAAEFTIPTEPDEPTFANIIWEAAESAAQQQSITELSSRVAETQQELRLLGV